MTKPAYHIDPKLKEWATPAQAQYIDLVNKHGGSRRAAAKAVGLHYSTITKSLNELLKKVRQISIEPNGTPGFVARELSTSYDADGEVTGSSLREGPDSVFEHGGVGEGPERDGGDGYIVKGISTYFRADGSQGGQWIKTKLDEQQRIEAMKAAAAAMSEDLPRLNALARPAATLEDLCNLYTLTDSHVGMLAWAKEAGEPWDLKIAERTLTGCFEQMMLASPPAKIGIVNQLGDWMHFDSLSAVTPLHGHILDADSRFSKMVEVAIRILRRVIDLALMRHDHVHVILAEGNHDMASSVWLRHMFKALYENEPRVTVNDNELPYYVYQHGTTMLAFHHGHLSKKPQLPLLFAAMYPVMWGATTKRYVHTGHMHHKDEKEHAGITVVQHPTLAAKDAYGARGGWLSEREATAMTYHRKFGLVARNTVTPEMIEQS